MSKRTSESSVELNRDYILSVAASLFQTRGYAQTTTRQLAAALGIEKGSLYYHYQRKEDILVDICTESLRHITSKLQDVIDRYMPPSADVLEPSEFLSRAIVAHVTEALSRRNMHSVMLVELKSISDDRREVVRAMRREYERNWESIIEYGRKTGAIRIAMPTRLVTLALMNLLNWTIFWFNDEGELQVEEWAWFLAEVFLSGCGTESLRSSAGSLQTVKMPLSFPEATS